MVDVFILGVPVSDSVELKSLAEGVVTAPEFSEHRYFDGATFVETLLPLVLSTATWATLRTWIRARADAQKVMRVSVDGVEITGMKPKDAERIINTLSRRITVHGDE